MALVMLRDGSERADRELIGNKAYSINEMMSLDLPVPTAFVLTTDVCAAFEAEGRVPDAVLEQVGEAVRTLEEATGRKMGGSKPLLVSVRSGAAESMPGMMDTILNLGMNPVVEQALGVESGDPRYAGDTHRRFREQFAKVVGEPPPEDPSEQLRLGLAAVFRSWRSPRAIAYREHHGIDDRGGTAAIVQAMVFGNLDSESGSGVLFTRNPLTGDDEPFGQWLPRSQGEDIVSGRLDALPLASLAERMPAVHEGLLAAGRLLESRWRDVQDIEFTVEGGVLWLLQSRSAKRSPDAAVRIAVQLCREGVISVDEALSQVTPSQVAAVQRPHVAPGARVGAILVARGQPACPGVGWGTVAMEVDRVVELAQAQHDVVLGRPTTEPEDIRGMIAARAVITEVGGATSHAAVVSRELGRPCVVGCGAGAVVALAGRSVTVDGSTGEVFEGALSLVTSSEVDDPYLATFGDWARARTGSEESTPLLSVVEQIHRPDARP